jgi:hypothetical protein
MDPGQIFVRGVQIGGFVQVGQAELSSIPETQKRLPEIKLNIIFAGQIGIELPFARWPHRYRNFSIIHLGAHHTDTGRCGPFTEQRSGNNGVKAGMFSRGMPYIDQKDVHAAIGKGADTTFHFDPDIVMSLKSGKRPKAIEAARMNDIISFFQAGELGQAAGDVICPLYRSRRLSWATSVNARHRALPAPGIVPAVHTISLFAGKVDGSQAMRADAGYPHSACEIGQAQSDSGTLRSGPSTPVPQDR